MCGIWGISYGEQGPDGEMWTPSEFMEMMFPAIVHRGPHAFGWMWYDGEDVFYQKHAGRVTDKGNMAKLGIEGDESKVRWLVGHVRYYTHGSPSNNLNNHPIQHGNILGVHNGVIRNYGAILSETGRDNPETEVDSEAIFAAVDNFGHRAGLRRIQGDMVTVYTNLEKPSTLHIARTIGRPLETCKSSAGSFFFASEEKVIEGTGITHTPYSSVSRNRLLRVREGKITERIDLFRRDRVAESIRTDDRPYMMPDRSAPPWFSEIHRGRGDIPAPPVRPSTVTPRPPSTNPHAVLADALAAQNRRRDARDSGRAAEAQALRSAASHPAAKLLNNHDEFRGFYYMDGVLMTKENYIRTMADVAQEGEL